MSDTFGDFQWGELKDPLAPNIVTDSYTYPNFAIFFGAIGIFVVVFILYLVFACTRLNYAQKKFFRKFLEDKAAKEEDGRINDVEAGINVQGEKEGEEDKEEENKKKVKKKVKEEDKKEDKKKVKKEDKKEGKKEDKKEGETEGKRKVKKEDKKEDKEKHKSKHKKPVQKDVQDGGIENEGSSSSQEESKTQEIKPPTPIQADGELPPPPPSDTAGDGTPDSYNGEASAPDNNDGEAASQDNFEDEAAEQDNHNGEVSAPDNNDGEAAAPDNRDGAAGENVEASPENSDFDVDEHRERMMDDADDASYSGS